MNGFLHRPDDHERALDLAALRVDEPLDAADAAWLEAHLAGCDPCAATAAGFESDAALFAPLRDAAPVPPRDLWARTAAAIDAQSGSRRSGIAGARRVFGLPASTLAPIAGIAVVAVVVSSALLAGGPVIAPQPGQSPEPTAIAMGRGDVGVLTRNADGTLEYRSAGVDELCPVVAEGCVAAAPSFAVSPVAGLDAGGDVAAIMSPGRDRLVVVQRSASGTDGVFVVPVRPAGTTTVDRTPAPTRSATIAPSDSPAPVATDAATAAPSAAVSYGPDPSAPGSPDVTASPVDTSSAAPTASDSAAPSPVATPEPTREPTPEPTVTVTPAPDGTLEIARNVVVVGNMAAYSADGSQFAFTARPASGSAGPDVYVWNTSDTRARAVTRDHRSLFAGWDGPLILVSRVVDGEPRTVSLSARTGAPKGDTDVAAWLPTVSPDGTLATWWDGTVRLADDGITWVADKGRLVLSGWPLDPAGDVQVLARGEIDSFEVRWAPDGTTVAIWTAGDGVKASGRLNLYKVDSAGRARTGSPLLEDEAAFDGFSIEDGRLAYAAPGKDGKRTVWVFGWKGDTVGKVQLPGDGGTTVVR